MIKNWQTFNEQHEDDGYARLTQADIEDIEELASEGMDADSITTEMNHKDYITTSAVQTVINNYQLHNESNNTDISFAISKITDSFSKEKVAEMLKAEKLEWFDSEEEYNNKNNGEAEDVIIDFIISDFEGTHEKVSNKSELEEAIKKEYSI